MDGCVMTAQRLPSIKCTPSATKCSAIVLADTASRSKKIWRSTTFTKITPQPIN